MADPGWQGVDEVLARLRIEQSDLIKHFSKRLDQSGLILRRAIRKNISLSDHSLEDLAELDHPYAKRNPHPPHDPPWLVHTQEGVLLKSLKKKTTKRKNEVVVSVGFDEQIAPHARDIIFGNSKMISRDVINGSASEVEAEIINTMSSL